MFESVKSLFFIVISTAASVWILNRFWSSFFEKKKVSLSSLIPWFLYCIFQIWMLYDRLTFQPAHSSLSLLVNTLLMFLVVICGYEAVGQEKYFLFLLFCIIWSLIELSLELLLNIFRLDWYTNMSIGSASSIILMTAFSHIVSLLWDRKYMGITPHRFYFPLLLIPVGSIYIIIVQYTQGNSYLISSIIMSILLLFNLIIFHIYIKINQFFLREKENAVYAEQLSMVSKNMEEQKKLMEEFYEEKHNLINELTALRSGITQENNEGTVRNLDKILACYHGMGSISSCGHSTVDAIINAKYAIAREYGISFHLHICVPEELAIAQCDLGVVIGNALDNAITAVRECTLTEKVIEISIGVKKNAWIMVMKNPYEHVLKKTRSGEILSTKVDVKKHGYGLRSIRRIAEAYAGDVVIDTDNGWFSLTVVLNFGEF